MVRELIKRAKSKFVDAEMPVFFTFHVYRSLKDHQHNIAIARVDWITPDHPGFIFVKEVFEWAPFRVRQEHDSDDLRKFLAHRTATVQEFVLFIEKIGTLLDDLAKTLLRNGVEADSRKPWDRETQVALREAERIWNEMAQSPTELVFVESFISGYINALDENRWIRDDEANISQEQRERWYQENIRALIGYYSSWPLLLKAGGWPLSH